MRLIAILVILLGLGHSPWAQASADKREKSKPVLRIEVEATGPFAGEASRTCTVIFPTGRVWTASWVRSWVWIDSPAKPTVRNQLDSKEYMFRESDLYGLEDLLDSREMRNLPSTFKPPHTPIDYFETTKLSISRGETQEQTIELREYYVASLSEKARYPSALVVLLGRVAELEEAVKSKGKPVEPPAECGFREGQQQP